MSLRQGPPLRIVTPEEVGGEVVLLDPSRRVPPELAREAREAAEAIRQDIERHG